METGRVDRDAASVAPKVAIPRLERNDPPSGDRKRDRQQKEPRIARACMNCRRRKVRCSGETPRCANCNNENIECVYYAPRRDRLKLATQQNQTLVTLLKDLSLRLDDYDRQRVEEALGEIEEDLDAPAPPQHPAPASQNPPGKRKKSSSDEEPHDTLGEAIVPASIDSTDDLNILDEDLLRNRGSRETGFIGQTSEVQWLRSLQREVSSTSDEPFGLPYGPARPSSAAAAQRSQAFLERHKSTKSAPMRPVAEATFYLDQDSIKLEEDVTLRNMGVMPDPATAKKLFNCFMDTVHDSFPMVPEFTDQFSRYFEAVEKKKPFEVPKAWLASVNFIFAIAAKYSHITKAEWRGDDRDHLVYMTRGVRILAFKDTLTAIPTPDLQLIQATGLLSFYYLIVGHVSRAWIMVGVSIRFALSLGLHMRNDTSAPGNPGTPYSQKEQVVKIWWSLHALECILSAATGRPCVLAHEDCTAPLPQELEESSRGSTPSAPASRVKLGGMSGYRSPTELSGSSGGSNAYRRGSIPRSYLDALVCIGLLTQKTLGSLYAPRIGARSWQYIQKTITQLLEELEEWKSGVLPDEGGASAYPFPPPSGPRETLLLRFRYLNTKILITRPCLCRTEHRIPSQSEGSASFDQQTAEVCVRAAQQVSHLLPDRPVPQELYSTGPWWSITHNIMQALAVLLLELSYQSCHMKSNGNEVFSCAKRLIQWLHALGMNDPLPQRAYSIVSSLFQPNDARFQLGGNSLLAEGNPSIDHKQLPFKQLYGFPAQPWSVAGDEPKARGYGGNYPAHQVPDKRSLHAANVDAQLHFDMNQLQQEAAGSSQSQLQSQPQEPYLNFLPNPINPPLPYWNPFVTPFDQEVPMTVSMDELWSPTDVSGPSQQQGDPAFEPK